LQAWDGIDLEAEICRLAAPALQPYPNAATVVGDHLYPSGFKGPGNYIHNRRDHSNRPTGYLGTSDGRYSDPSAMRQILP
jgi:hypothetical protein